MVGKHGNPCGVGSGENIEEAWDKASKADKVSIYGSIVAINNKLTLELAGRRCSLFLEVLVIPSYEKEALELLQEKRICAFFFLEDIDVLQDENAYDLKR